MKESLCCLQTGVGVWHVWVQAVLDYTTALHNPCNERFYYHTNSTRTFCDAGTTTFKRLLRSYGDMLLCTAGLTSCQFELVRDFSYD